jgi:hypothetical protein
MVSAPLGSEHHRRTAGSRSEPWPQRKTQRPNPIDTELAIIGATRHVPGAITGTSGRRSLRAITVPIAAVASPSKAAKRQARPREDCRLSARAIQDGARSADRRLEFDPIAPVDTAASFGGVSAGRGDPLEGGLPLAGLGGVLPPRLAPGGAAFVVAVQQGGDDAGQQDAVGACGFGVHGAGSLVVGQDHPEVVCGGVFVAAPQGMDVGAGDRCDVLAVGLAAALVDERFVVVPAA